MVGDVDDMVALFQCIVLERFVKLLEENPVTAELTPNKLKPVLTRLCTLFGLWSMEKHLTTLYQG